MVRTPRKGIEKIDELYFKLIEKVEDELIALGCTVDNWSDGTDFYIEYKNTEDKVLAKIRIAINLYTEPDFDTYGYFYNTFNFKTVLVIFPMGYWDQKELFYYILKFEFDSWPEILDISKEFIINSKTFMEKQLVIMERLMAVKTT